MGYDVVRAGEVEWIERALHEGEQPRRIADVTAAAQLESSRARLWVYPPHTRGRRHVERAQEEVFVCLRGTLTMLLGEPPERVDLGPGELVAVHVDTPLQARNEGDEEVHFFVYGAPPVTGRAEYLDDVETI